VAEDKAVQLNAIRADLTSARDKLQTAQNAFENANIQVDEMKRRLKDKIEEAQRAIQESRRAETMRKASDALVQLDSYGVGQTNEEFLGKIREKSAEAQAAVEIATGGAEIDRMKAERGARRAQARSVLGDLEVEMGLKQATPESVQQESTVGPRQKVGE
jgi:phage shock protein A